MKPAGWFGLVIIIAALAFGMRSFVTNLTPYVTFKEARAAQGTVQVMGKLDKSTVIFKDRKLAFTIISAEGDRMPVEFTAAKPANFSQATQVTAIGKFDGTVMRANDLLVKCPSKYQGNETTKSYGSAGS